MTETKYWKLELARGAGTDVAKLLPPLDVAGWSFERVAIVCGVHGRVTIEPLSRMDGTGWKPATWREWQEAESRARKAAEKAACEEARRQDVRRFAIATTVSGRWMSTSTVHIVRATKTQLIDSAGRKYLRSTGRRIGRSSLRCYIDHELVEGRLAGRERVDIIKERKAAGDYNEGTAP